MLRNMLLLLTRELLRKTTIPSPDCRPLLSNNALSFESANFLTLEYKCSSRALLLLGLPAATGAAEPTHQTVF